MNCRYVHRPFATLAKMANGEVTALPSTIGFVCEAAKHCDVFAGTKQRVDCKRLLFPIPSHVHESPDDALRALRRSTPWHYPFEGPESIVRTFVDVGRYWEKQAF